MGKRKILKANVALTEAPEKAAQHLKSPGIQKKSSTGEAELVKHSKSFIDDLFATSKKSGRPEASKQGKQATSSTSEAPSRPKETKGKKDDLFGLVEEARKKTEEGWNIYTEAELKLNKKGGDTELCPFDCDCCF